MTSKMHIEYQVIDFMRNENAFNVPDGIELALNRFRSNFKGDLALLDQVILFIRKAVKDTEAAKAEAAKAEAAKAEAAKAESFNLMSKLTFG